jgi:UDP-N-acetylglucosamine--N-acetylmuramyl-(pentapeptide) pyrophosphoryl-undecaprenol N-acetylglucosamine transferase
MMSEQRIVFAGGGTGGHLFPGIALAQELQQRADSLEIVFAVSSKSLDSELLGQNGFETRTLGTAGWRGGIFRYPLMMLGMASSAVKSFLFMAGKRCRSVIGLGGYASFGPILAGWFLRKKIYLLEQNTVPGKANRVLSRFAENVFIQFESSGKYFPEGKALPMGNPVRREILDLDSGKESAEFTLLVMGGSQGAKKLNEIFIDACNETEFPEKSRIVHLCGDRNLEECRDRYSGTRTSAEVEVIGFQKDMASLIGKADLCLCRSGATSIAELTCAGVPMIMVPFPYATDDHQYLNAKELEERGAGICIREEELTPGVLAGLLNRVLKDSEGLKTMRDCSRKAGMPGAGPEIAEYILKRIAG